MDIHSEGNTFPKIDAVVRTLSSEVLLPKKPRAALRSRLTWSVIVMVVVCLVLVGGLLLVFAVR